MTEPIAFFLTWTTYGTWLPGDARGWIEYGHGWRLPSPPLELECASRMTEDACRLTPDQRLAVEQQIIETCEHRGWHLHAVNCRSNHIHVVVSAPNVRPKKVRIDLKAWATRVLKSRFDPGRENWWAERGSIRHIHNAAALEAAIYYTNEAQDRKTDLTRRISEGPRADLTRRVSEGREEVIRRVSEGREEGTRRVSEGREEVTRRVSEGREEVTRRVSEGREEVTRRVSEGLPEGARDLPPTPDETGNPSLTRRVTSYPVEDQT